MFEYKSDILETSIKLGAKDSANEKDLSQLEELINSRAKEGWELASHAYMPNVLSTRSAFLITFKKLV